MSDLTPRQREVLSLMCEGKPNKVIARDLGVSPHTVKELLYRSYKHLGVSTRVQAALAFQKKRD